MHQNNEGHEAGRTSSLDPRVARMKERLLNAPYEICMERALHFTRSYRATERLDPHLRNAMALKRTLEKQTVRIEPDEQIVGNKTAPFLASPLPVERGDFLRSLQIEISALDKKKRPFKISKRDRRLFEREILPYWDGRTLRDRKARAWARNGLIREQAMDPLSLISDIGQAVRWRRSLGEDTMRLMAGPAFEGGVTPRQAAALFSQRHALAHNNPTPATYCFDVQGHLCLGVHKVVQHGMEAICEQIRERLARLEREAPADREGAAFLDACLISLEAAMAWAARFAALARQMAAHADMPEERERLEMIARHCDHAPRHRPRSFHEAVQALWFAQAAGEIQYGCHEVFAPGRCDQYLYPFYKADLDEGRITRESAMALLQELNLKLTANVEPIPELGSETNASLGNSQHCITIGGLTPSGEDAVNDLSYLMLDAYEQMGGCLNQLSVRVHAATPREFVASAVRVLRRASGIAFYGDDAIVEGLLGDGMEPEHARDYCIVGCIETSGHGDTHGCPGGHELTLPAIVILTLTEGRLPAPAPGQRPAPRTGNVRAMASWDDFVRAFRSQLAHHIRALVRGTAAKDRAYMDFLPAPYVSALMSGCVEAARDITRGGARYDFTSLDLRGLATAADSLIAIRKSVFEHAWLTLPELVRACESNFRGKESLSLRLRNNIPKFGADDYEATAMALELVEWVNQEAARHTNARGGRYRVCFYSYGNHVIDGLLLPATPDGRPAGAPVSNGISPANAADGAHGPLPVLRAAASVPPRRASSGVSLNLRFHPSVLASENGCGAFTDMLRAYFKIGGMHVQPNVVSTQTLRLAQADPDAYRDLVVKVSGYSAYFTDLGRSIQDDIIARTEHGMET